MACGSGWERARSAFVPAKTYSLGQIAKNLTRDEVLWFILHRARRDEKTLAGIRRWVVKCGGKVRADADLPACFSAVQRVLVASIPGFRAGGLSPAEAREAAREVQYRCLLEVFK